MSRHLGFLALIISFCLHAQEFRSTLAGRVVDPTGAVIVGAKVAAIETNTNSRYATVTNSDGLYNFPLLLPGEYELTVEAKGFKGYSQKGIRDQRQREGRAGGRSDGRFGERLSDHHSRRRSNSRRSERRQGNPSPRMKSKTSHSTVTRLSMLSTWALA